MQWTSIGGESQNAPLPSPRQWTVVSAHARKPSDASRGVAFRRRRGSASRQNKHLPSVVVTPTTHPAHCPLPFIRLAFSIQQPVPISNTSRRRRQRSAVDRSVDSCLGTGSLRSLFPGAVWVVGVATSGFPDGAPRAAFPPCPPSARAKQRKLPAAVHHVLPTALHSDVNVFWPTGRSPRSVGPTKRHPHGSLHYIRRIAKVLS